jgi:GAF domain-containing protein
MSTVTGDARVGEGTAVDAKALERLIALSTEKPAWRIRHALDLARELLGLEFSYITEFRGDEQLIQGVSGDRISFDMSPGDGYPLDGSYCQRMIDGKIPHVVPDTSANPEARDLAVTKMSAIGAYVGVPVHLYEGKLYGTLCAVSHQPHPELGAREVRLLELLSQVVTGALEQQRTERENQRLRDRIGGLTDELDAAEEDRRVSRILMSGEFRTIPHGTPPPE